MLTHFTNRLEWFSTKQELVYDYKSAIPGSYVDIGVSFLSDISFFLLSFAILIGIKLKPTLWTPSRLPYTVCLAEELKNTP